MNDRGSRADIDGAADAIRIARRKRSACEPIADRFDITTLDQAYAVQAKNTLLWTSEGRRIVGRKIGLTSTAVQQQMGIDQPDFGMLYADMEFTDGTELESNKLIQPKAEAEIALVLEKACPETDLSFSQILHRIAYAVPAIEVVDSAIADWRIGLFDTVADNASSGVYVLGTNAKSIQSIDLRICGMVMERNGAVASTGVGAACLGHPIQSALWLARKMVELNHPLDAGDVVLTGALGPMVSVGLGEDISVEIGGLGMVRTRFV